MTTYQLEAASTWMDGNSLVGQINEIELPEVEWEMMEQETIGLLGVQEFPKRVNALEATISWAGYSPELATAAADPWTLHQFQVRSNFGQYQGGGKTADRLQVIEFAGTFKTNSLGTVGSDEYERETVMAVSSFKEIWDGLTVVEFSIDPPVYRIGATGSNLGNDIFQAIRTNLGF